MADNTLLNSGSGGDTIRDIDKAGIKTQVVALDAGGSGAESLVTASNPLPVKVGDGTNSAAIKAASTAAAATDPSIVVNISPNSPAHPVTATNATAANFQTTATQALGTAGTRWFAQISDGTNSPAIKAASTAAGATDPSIVVNISPNSPAHPVTATNATAANFQMTATQALGTAGTRWFAQISDGTNSPAIKAASTAAATADPAMVVSFAGANSATKIGDGTNNAVITAASTAAATGSASLTVALSPNSPLPVTTGSTMACSTGLASSLTVANIKASAGNVMGLAVQNPNASTIYIQFYNTAGTPTLGTSVVWWIPVPASGTVFLPPGAFALANHATGIGVGASTTPTSTGTPGSAPNVVVFYK